MIPTISSAQKTLIAVDAILIMLRLSLLRTHTTERVRPQCGQLKPRMLKIQRFWAYILDFLYKYLDISS